MKGLKQSSLHTPPSSSQEALTSKHVTILSPLLPPVITLCHRCIPYLVFLIFMVTATAVDISRRNDSQQEVPERDILMGYLTGSQRRPGDNLYSRPGQTISGALTYAIDVINKQYPLVGNRKLNFVVAETYGDETESIKKTAELWSQDKVDVYIGPQETCVHEARMSDSFNLPMISYVSRNKRITLVLCCFIHHIQQHDFTVTFHSVHFTVVYGSLVTHPFDIRSFFYCLEGFQS